MTLSLKALLCLSSAMGAKGFTIEAMKHDIQVITPPKFDGVIGKFRDNSASALWFFKDNNADDEKFLDSYNAVAKELKGMSKICAINCNEFSQFCTKQGVSKFPTVMVYPPNPVPAFTYEGKMETKAIAGRISKLIPDYSVVLKSGADADTLLSTDVTKPKVLLFSDKKKAPTIFKALSSETVFRRSIKFGFVGESNEELSKRFKVTKYPTIVQLRGAKSEVREVYKGDMTFQGIQEWVNLYSESGMGDKVSGGGKEEQSAEEAKPWLVQEVPELTSKSSNDICFKGEGLCVIYLKDGEVSAGETEMLTKLSKKFTSQLSDRGAKMKWMWMNLALESGFKALFEPTQMPSAVVFNPHKRLRFAKMDHGEDNEIKGDENALSNLMDKVLGGDARFKIVPGQKLPTWATRDSAKPGKKEL